MRRRNADCGRFDGAGDGRTGSFGIGFAILGMALTVALVVMLAVVMTGFAMQTGTFERLQSIHWFCCCDGVRIRPAIGLFLLVGSSFGRFRRALVRVGEAARCGPTMLAVHGCAVDGRDRLHWCTVDA